MRKTEQEKIAEMSREVKRLTSVVEAEIVTRGVNLQGQTTPVLDLGSIHENVSWSDIEDMKPDPLKRG